MSPPAARLVPILSAVLLLSSASAFNITVLLARYPGFEQFNQLLSQTLLAEDINRRSTITVLGLPNDRLGTVMQMTPDIQKKILSLHIVLDYYDMIKLNKLAPASKTTVTTLYQSSGVADDKQGFIDVVHRRDGTIVFGSSMPGSPLVSNLVNSVYSQPYNISVLSVSQPIVAPGIDGFWMDPPPPPAKAAVPGPALAQAPAPIIKKPAASPVAEEPVADEPTADASAPSPADAPASASAPAPAADAPAEDGAEEDASDEAETGEKKEKKSAAVKQVISGVTAGLVIGLASFLAAQ